MDPIVSIPTRATITTDRKNRSFDTIQLSGDADCVVVASIELVLVETELLEFIVIVDKEELWVVELEAC